MRVLCTVIGSASHGRSLLPLARALAAARHEVLIAIGPAVPPLARTLVAAGHEAQETIVSELTRVFAADEGLRTVPCTPKIKQDDPDPPDPSSDNIQRLDLLVTDMTGRMAIESLFALSPLADDFEPDLLVRDGLDLGACLLAELRGIPQISAPSGTANILDPADLLAGLNERREELGLPLQRSPLSLYPYGRIDYMPPGYSFAPLLPEALAYRQTPTVDLNATLPDWVAQLPTDRPLVFAALGTNLPMHHALSGEVTRLRFGVADPADTLRAIIDGLSLVDCVAVVATAGIPVDDAEPAAHVHLTEWVPQSLLLECADLLVTHGGFNSIREAVRTGTAMAVLPQFADQPHNARRVHGLGLGRVITEPSPEAVAATCRQVLAEAGIAARVRRAQRAALTLPDISRAVTDLEALVN
jgi:UDP:flavonoid glycosyltransferase YjiC (YdhE family)